MTNQPFDLDKIDYDKQRRRKRRKLLRRSLLAVVIAFLLMLWFGLPTPLTTIAIDHYNKKDFKSSRSWLTPLTVTSPEPFVSAYNSGTVDAKLGEYDRAESELSRAVSIAPADKLCMSVQNLASALQSHAVDANKHSDDKTVGESLAKMKEVLKKYPDCFMGGGGGGGGGGSSGSEGENKSPSKSQQKQLQQKEQAGRDRKAKYADQDTFDKNNPNIKRW